MKEPVKRKIKIEIFHFWLMASSANVPSISNLVFTNSPDGFLDEKSVALEFVHVRIQQRNARSSLTTIQGLKQDLDLKRISKALKKQYHTNGTVMNDSELGQVIQLQGDQRNNVVDFLVRFQICQKQEIKVHGY